MPQEQTTQPIVEEPKSTQIEENVPFKVFKTQEEYDNFAGYIRKSTTSSILDELGLQDKSQITELREQITQITTQNQELEPKVQQYEEQLADMQLESNLIGLGISKDDFDYVKLDLMKSQDLDLTNVEALSEFLGNTRWLNNTNQQETPKQQVEQPEVQEPELGLIQSNALSAFLGQ